MREVVVAGAVRTPIGKFGGSLAGLTAADLGATAAAEALRRAGVAPSLLHEMARRRARRGLAALCISGGMGLAAAFEAA